jgi:enoyl-CoA hydratase/carnithine racemase
MSRVRTERTGTIGRVIPARLEAKNALNRQMAVEIEAA